MPNTWFRLYAEFADDPKVQMLSEADQRRLVMLFCEHCKDVTHDETLRAFHWRVTPLELAATKSVFLQKGFIDEDWNLINWHKRQFISDSSTERVRRYREGKKQKETLQMANVTAPDTDTDTDTEQNKKQNREEQTLALTSDEVRAVAVFELPLPGKQGEWGVSQKLYAEMVDAYPGVNVMTELGKMRGWLIGNPQSRKTQKGLPRFINNWLSRAQDRGGNTNGRTNGRNNGADAAFQQALEEFGSGVGNHGIPQTSRFPRA